MNMKMFGTDHTRVRSSSSLRLTAAVRLRLESGKHVLRNFGLRNDKRIGRYLRLFFFVVHLDYCRKECLKCLLVSVLFVIVVDVVIRCVPVTCTCM